MVCPSIPFFSLKANTAAYSALQGLIQVIFLKLLVTANPLPIPPFYGGQDTPLLLHHILLPTLYQLHLYRIRPEYALSVPRPPCRYVIFPFPSHLVSSNRGGILRPGISLHLPVPSLPGGQPALTHAPHGNNHVL